MMIGRNKKSIKVLDFIGNDTIGAELGVWKGDSSAKFLTKAKHLHLVDSWSPIPYTVSDEHGTYENYLERYSNLVGSKNPRDFQNFYDKIYQSVVKRFKNESVTIHRMSTQQWFKSFKENLDWIYIDAGHGYDDCLYDLKNSLKIVKVGGLILGDDYSEAKPGVKRAVKAFSKEYNLSFEIFSETQFKFIVT